MGIDMLVPIVLAIIFVAILVVALKILFDHMGTAKAIQNLIFLLILVVVLVWLVNYLGLI